MRRSIRAAEAREAAIERAREEADRARDIARKYRDKDFAMRAVGVTPEYVAAMRSAAPQLARRNPNDFIAMKSVGVTPAYVQELANAGLTGCHWTSSSRRARSASMAITSARLSARAPVPTWTGWCSSAHWESLRTRSPGRERPARRPTTRSSR
jgi:hypothetical protein